jgi:hypothetical protein
MESFFVVDASNFFVHFHFAGAIQRDEAAKASEG